MSSTSGTQPASSSGQHSSEESATFMPATEVNHEFSDEASNFPAYKGESYRSIRPRQSAGDEVTVVDTKPFQSEPDYQTPERDGASGSGQEATTWIPPTGERDDPDEASGEDRKVVGGTSRLKTGSRKSNAGEGDRFNSLCDGSEEGPRVQVLSDLFHLASTNFVVKLAVGSLSLGMLMDALQQTLEQTNVDILEFVSCHSVYKCSYHQGNCYMALSMRVFEPPSVSSGNLLNTDITIAERVKGGLLVEVQLLEGDHLSFSTLFREILVNFSKLEDEIALMGTLRYKPRPFPEKGEGLFLEPIGNLKPPRFVIGLRQDDSSSIKLPSTITSEPLDEDMIEDVVNLVKVLEADFLDAQADAATAVAGLTDDAEFRELLSDPRAKKAADSLCRASARLLVETKYRPARRQAAVTVANLASAPVLCRSLLKSDPPLTSSKRGIVDALVALAILRSVEDEEEEIGTRRECMRALISLAESRSTRNMPAIKSLRSTTPSGRGAKCQKLMERLRMCRDVLARPATMA